MTSEVKPATKRPGSRLLSIAIVVGVGVLVLLFVLADSRQLLETIGHIEPWRLVLPIAASAASYLAMTRSYQLIARAARAPFTFRDMLQITFVANSMNYIVATGGISGLAVRLYFFTRRGVSAGAATSISLAQGLLTNVTLLFFILIGFGYLISASNMSTGALIASGTLLGLFVVAAIAAVALFFMRDFRRRLIFVAARASDRFMHRFLPRYKPARTRVWRFQRNLNTGIDFLVERKGQMVAPTAWIIFDWILTMGILQASFFCVGYNVAFSALIIGFALGLTLSLISIIPGGLGLMEGSMAAVFTSLGIPFETSVVAVLIFRLAFHVLPLVISVFFFHGLFVEGRAHQSD